MRKIKIDLETRKEIKRRLALHQSYAKIGRETGYDQRKISKLAKDYKLKHKLKYDEIQKAIFNMTIDLRGIKYISQRLGKSMQYCNYHRKKINWDKMFDYYQIYENERENIKKEVKKVLKINI